MSHEDIDEEKMIEVKDSISIGRAVGVLAGATSVNGNDDLVKILVQAVHGPEWDGDRLAAASDLSDAAEIFCNKIRKASDSGDVLIVHMLTTALVEGVLAANEDIETVTGSARFSKECPSSGCGGCEGC